MALDELARVDTDYRDAKRQFEEARRRRQDAIVRATADGVTQVEIARILGISQPSVAQILSRQRGTGKRGKG